MSSAALKTPDGTKKPDYVFYHDLAALNANKNRTPADAEDLCQRWQRSSISPGRYCAG